MYREFDTTYSNVQLEDKGILKFDAGYKLYENYQIKEPIWTGANKNMWQGHKYGIEWYIVDAVDGAITKSGLYLALAGAILAAF